MRVLQVNKYHYLRGGAERYYFESSRLLEESGCEVIFLSMAGPRNEPTAWSKHFVAEVDYRRNSSFAARVREAGKVIWNGEAFRKTVEIIERHRPDVAHLHNIAHQLSGSVVAALAGRGVPTVHTLHDYKLVCPAYRRFRDGAPCDSCFKRRYWEAVRHRCVLDRRAASLVAAVETGLYRAVGLYEKGVTRFHSPSRFLMETMIRWGLPEEKIEHFPYTLDVSRYEPGTTDDGTFLFFGRLSHEKGLPVLLDAAARLPAAHIVVAGEGPERKAMVDEAARRSIENVRFVGYLGGESLRNAIRSCRAVLLPSEYDDNSPLVIYESFAYGKPVIAADRGGIPEMVRPGETGYLFPSGDGEALAEAIDKLADSPALARGLGAEGRRRMETTYGPEAHLEWLTGLYERVIGEQ